MTNGKNSYLGGSTLYPPRQPSREEGWEPSSVTKSVRKKRDKGKSSRYKKPIKLKVLEKKLKGIMAKIGCAGADGLELDRKAQSDEVAKIEKEIVDFIEEFKESAKRNKISLRGYHWLSEYDK